ncbi:MAG: hypothetical protein DYG96_06195 [Chlorobi bacterium CHB2]|nr:hypothetical protein [Chlorobi bacterium CHB2]
MNIEDLISHYLDGTLSSEAEAELHHRLSVSPEARKIFKAQIALQGVARDARVLHTPTLQMRNALFDRLQREEGMGSLADSQAATSPTPMAALMLAEAVPPKSYSSAAKNAAINSELVQKEVIAASKAERRRRRLVALLLPLLVLVVASGIVWQWDRVGGGNGSAPPSLASDNSEVSVGIAQPQSAPKPTSETLAAKQPESSATEPSVTEKIGEELLAIHQPDRLSERASAREYSATSSGRGGAAPTVAATTPASIAIAPDDSAPLDASAPSGVPEGADDGAEASGAAISEEEWGGDALAIFDEDTVTSMRRFDAAEGTVVLNGVGSPQLQPPPADSAASPIHALLARDEESSVEYLENPLHRGTVYSNTLRSSDGISLMGPTEAAAESSSQVDSAADYGGGLAFSAPPPAPIVPDLQGRNPRGRNVIPPSKDLPPEVRLPKSEGQLESYKTAAAEPATVEAAAEQRSAKQGKESGLGAAITSADILDLQNNRLTFTELATERLLASKAVSHNARLQLNLDTATAISGTLVEQGEEKRRTRGETLLPYEVVGGKVVIDITALPAAQRQRLQEYLRKLGKAE